MLGGSEGTCTYLSGNTCRATAGTCDVDETCPECGQGLVVKLGKFGKFFACSGYPDCKYIRKMEKEKAEEAQKAEAARKAAG